MSMNKANLKRIHTARTHLDGIHEITSLWRWRMDGCQGLGMGGGNGVQPQRDNTRESCGNGTVLILVVSVVRQGYIHDKIAQSHTHTRKY